MTPATAHLRSLTPAHATLWLIAASTLLHLLVAGRVELSADEAHYALYGLFPDWSYFDHPPLVGWLQAVMLQFGDSEFVLRLLPILLFAGVSGLVYQLGRELFPTESPWLGFISVAILQSGVLFHLIGLAMLPDSPLLLLGLLALLLLWRALQRRQARYWIYLGLCLGLAGLAKYTAITLVITALLHVHLTQQWKVLRQPWPWLGTLLALLLILPVLYWNASHQWLSFQYQLSHGFRDAEWQLSRLLLTQAYQIVSYAPGIYVLGIVALCAALRDWRHPGVGLLLALVLPILLLFNWGAGHEESLPHWTSLAWAGTTPLLARWLLAHWQRRWVRIATWLSASYSVVVVLLLHSLMFSPWLALPPQQNVLRDVQGWHAAAQQAAALQQQMAGQAGPEPILMVSNWSLASRLAWYARPTPVRVADSRFDQFDLWFGAPQAGDRGILVVPAYFKQPDKLLRTHFESCEPPRQLPVYYQGRHQGHLQVTYNFYACYNFRP